MSKILRFLLISITASVAWSMFSGAFAASSYTSFATADAFVATGPTGNLRNNNYGGGGALAIAAGNLPNGEFQSVIRFDLSGARNSLDAQYGAGQWTIQSVSLQLTSSPHNNVIYNDVAAGLFGISLLQNNSWTEGTGNASSPATNGITFNTLQSTFINNAADQGLGTFNFNGGTNGANNYVLGLSSGLTGDILSGGALSLRLYAADQNVSYLFSSRAMPSASQPQLIIIAVPEPRGFLLFGAGLALFLGRDRGLRIARSLHEW